MRLHFSHRIGAIVLVGLVSVPASAQDWLDYFDESTARLSSDPTLGVLDVDEKDFAWGDVDQDGDVDLICVRKQPWMSSGRRRNVLFMNEGTAEGHAIDGVLVDRTVDYASAATDGGQGFLDLTADRDIQLVDVDGDGWLDMVTSTAFGTGLPKTISHPRVYRNLGVSAGSWLGFRYEDSRTPTMPQTFNFCGIAYGDVTGDGAPDLYFTDYETTLEDRLWINDGQGVYADESTARMTFQMRESEFAPFAVTGDVNGDGANDIIKCRSNGTPYRLSVSYNDPSNEGFFNEFEVPLMGAPYYIEIGDLNNDGLLDLVAQDDGIDRYLLNQGNGIDGLANFTNLALPTASDGFSGKTLLEDMNGDGFLDIIIADTAVNGFGCSRHLKIWRNLGNTPNVTFVEETGGLSVAERLGTWDVAPIDLNGDGYKDMVIGRCSGISIWMAIPPADVHITYPQGLPRSVPPSMPYELQVHLQAIGQATIPVGGVQLYTSVGGAPLVPQSMIDLGGGTYSGSLPAGDCLDRTEFTVEVTTAEGGTFTDPPGAPTEVHATIAASGESTLLDDPIGPAAAGWTITTAAGVTTGWEAAIPNGTFTGVTPVAPAEDAGPIPSGYAFVTGNGLPGEAAGTSDLDGGPTTLTAPPLDLTGSDAVISYDRWIYSALGVTDPLVVSISGDGGGLWVQVETVTSTESAWQHASFLVSEFVAPSADVRVRFEVSDEPNDSITEAGIDNFRVERLACDGFIRGDCNADGGIDVSDPVHHLLRLFGGGGVLACDDACDSGDDGMLDIADPIATLGYLFASGLPPAEPFPNCGADGTAADPLGCAGYPPCP